MFIGHYAVALGSKKAVPKVKLGTLLLAALFLDLLFPLFLLLGIEHVRIIPGVSPFTRLDLYDYPISHNMLTSLLWSLLVSGFYYIKNKYKIGAIVIGSWILFHTNRTYH
jgi:hypothetical protein